MNSPECNVCHIDLDEEDHQPRHLGCSHDACTACIKALIKNGLLECPMCRQVVKAYTPDDLQINHGLVQVLRMFKEFKISQNRPKEEGATANIKEICRIHEQTANKRCVSCKVWICVQCKEIHTPDIGCEVQEYEEFLKKRKKEHKDQVESILSSIRKNLQSLTTKLSGIESEKKRLEEEIEKLQKVVKEGSKAMNKVVAANANVEKADTSMELNECMNISNEWHQFAQIWCKKNTDKPLNCIEVLKSGTEVYATKDVNGKSSSGKVSLANGYLLQHCLRLNGSNASKSAKVYPYEEVLTWLPSVRNLVFLDLAIAGVVQGHITIRFRQDLPNYAKNIPLMFTGEEGHSLLDLALANSCWESHLLLPLTPITKTMKRFTRDTNAGCTVVAGSVIAQWSGNVFVNLYIQFEQGDNHHLKTAGFDVIGVVESGLDIVKLCSNHSPQKQVTVNNCGLVFKDDVLRV